MSMATVKKDTLPKIAMNNTPSSQTALTTLWLALVLIILDQLTKYWANTSLEFMQPYAVMPNLNFTLIYNEGAAFSFLSDMGGWQRWFFAALAVGVSAGLVYWLSRLPKVWTAEVISINLILSGAIGNVIDRIWQGKVTDFIDFYIGTWHYATFNVADVAISIGAVLLIYSEFFVKKKTDSSNS
jgi:signal peptidase II